MTDTELTTRRQSRGELEAELRLAGAGDIRGKKAFKCPFHEDNHPSAGLYEREGVWRFKCQACGAGGDVFDIRARRMSRPLEDVLREVGADRTTDDHHAENGAKSKPKRVFESIEAIEESVGHMGTVEAVYRYADPSTRAVDVVQVRYRDAEGKHFLTHRAHEGGFVLGAPGKPWPIYNRARVAAADTVVVVEGEKCVHALHELGIVATTSLSGAGNADKADWSLLAGKKVYIWPDNDEAGAKYAAAVARALDELNPHPAVRLLNVVGLGLGDHGDVADFIADGADGAEIWRVLESGSAPVGAASDLFERIDAIITGTWASIDWPWASLSRGCKSLFPGTITVICGDPSASKSFFLLEAMEHWHRQDIAVDLLELEEDRAFHLQRLLAIKSGTWDVMDDSWGRQHPDKLCEFYGEHEPAVQSFAPRLHAGGLGKLRYAEMLEWIQKRCELGAKIIGIDPITAVATGENRQIEDLDFIVKSSNILRDFGARLILVTHPRQSGMKASGQDDVAGGRAFSRHTQTVLMLHRQDPPEEMNCKSACGYARCVCNRVARIAKARNAPGHGWRIGFNLGQNVRFAEQGVVVED